MEQKEAFRIGNFFNQYVGIKDDEEITQLIESLDVCFVQPTSKRERLNPRNAFDKLVLYVLENKVGGNYFIGCKYIVDYQKKEKKEELKKIFAKENEEYYQKNTILYRYEETKKELELFVTKWCRRSRKPITRKMFHRYFVQYLKKYRCKKMIQKKNISRIMKDVSNHYNRWSLLFNKVCKFEKNVIHGQRYLYNIKLK